MKVSIMIPTYNERQTVGEVINKVKRLNLPMEKEILVVDDGSQDGSFELIKKIKGIKFFKHEKNRGKGAAVKTALKHVTGDFFIVQDADLELNPEEISNVIGPLVEKRADVVYGSRSPSITRVDRSPLFYFGGMFVTMFTNLLYGTSLTDEPCGYKAFKTEILRELNIKEDRFEWEPEVTAKISKKGIRIHEVPVSFNSSRTHKEGKKLRGKDGLMAIWTLFKYRFKD